MTLPCSSKSGEPLEPGETEQREAYPRRFDDLVELIAGQPPESHLIERIGDAFVSRVCSVAIGTRSENFLESRSPTAFY